MTPTPLPPQLTYKAPSTAPASLEGACWLFSSTFAHGATGSVEGTWRAPWLGKHHHSWAALPHWCCSFPPPWSVLSPIPTPSKVPCLKMVHTNISGGIKGAFLKSHLQSGNDECMKHLISTCEGQWLLPPLPAPASLLSSTLL